MEGLTQLGGLVLTVGMTYGPVVALLGLLNLRDRRQSRLLGSVVQELPRGQFGGRLAVQVRSALLSPRSVVTLDMRACLCDEIWQAVARLSRSLPAGVRLVVDGTVDPHCPAPAPSRLPVPARRGYRLARAGPASAGRTSLTARGPLLQNPLQDLLQDDGVVAVGVGRGEDQGDRLPAGPLR